jgi:hypothetical protein
VALWVMDAATITSAEDVANVWIGWKISGIGDFNGDKRADILWQDATDNMAIWLMNGSNVMSYSQIP